MEFFANDSPVCARRPECHYKCLDRQNIFKNHFNFKRIAAMLKESLRRICSPVLLGFAAALLLVLLNIRVPVFI